MPMLTQSPEERQFANAFPAEYSVPFNEMLMNDVIARLGWYPDRQIYTDLKESGALGQTVRMSTGKPTTYGDVNNFMIRKNINQPTVSAIANEMGTRRPELLNTQNAMGLDWNAESFVPIHEARHIGLAKLFADAGKDMKLFTDDNREEAMFRLADLESQALSGASFDTMEATRRQLNRLGAAAFGNPGGMLTGDEVDILRYELDMYRQMANDLLQKQGRQPSTPQF